MACPGLRDEFQLKKFGFSGIRAERFCFFQWRWPVALYLTYRFVVMGYALFWLGFLSTHGGHPPQAWGAYLTIWTYILLNVYLVVHFFAASLHHLLALCDRGPAVHAGGYLLRRPSAASHARMFSELNPDLPSRESYEAIPQSEGGGGEVGSVTTSLRPPWYLCVVWVLFSVVSSAAVMVTFVFFVFLFPGLSDYPHISLDNLQEHAINSVIVLVEHLVSAAPFRLLHVVYPFLYGVMYMVFSVVYWAGDHDRVMYPILNWNKPWPTVGYVFMVGFVFIPVLHVGFYLVYRLKLAIHHRFSCRDSEL